MHMKKGEGSDANSNLDENYHSLAQKAHGAAYAKIAAEKWREEELKVQGIEILKPKR